MHLISCDECGVVLDQNKLCFLSDIHEEDGSIDDTKAAYNHKTGNYSAKVSCPVCKSDLLKGL